jgi:hypothetical protein
MAERPSLAPQLNRNPQFTARERADMIAFLRSLSSAHGSHGSPGGAR